jgi:lipopolysaccharide transport system permease protein
MEQNHFREISANQKFYQINFGEFFRYKDLLVLFVKRDFVAQFKQTILGPLWFIIQPVLTALTYFIVFGKFAQVPTLGVPGILFFLTGVIFWNFFSEAFLKISDTFFSKANLFGKVYFPRIILPVSVLASASLKLGIQLLILLVLYFYFYFFEEHTFTPSVFLIALPLVFIFLSLAALGLGCLVSSLTTRYRDLKFLISFLVQLWMFATPVVYPYVFISGKIRIIMDINPLTPFFELIRLGMFSGGSFLPQHLLFSGISILLMLVLGFLVFNRTQRNFMDTV